MFYDLNDNTVTLAKDLLDHVQKGGRRSRSMPLLVFCDLSSAAVADGNGMAQQVREEAYGCATVVFTPLGLESVPGHLARWTQTRCNVYYLVVSNDTDDNVRATIALCDTLTSQMVSWEMGARAWDVDRVGARPSLTDRTRRYAGNIHVWCVHGNPDDDLIFDSSPTAAPTRRSWRASSGATAATAPRRSGAVASWRASPRSWCGCATSWRCACSPRSARWCGTPS